MPILTSDTPDQPPFQVTTDVPGGMVHINWDQGAYGRYLTQAEVVALIRELRASIGLEPPIIQAAGRVNREPQAPA